MASDVSPDAGNSAAARLERVIMASPVLEPIIRRWAEISLPDCWLVAGAIVQTVWNDAFGFDPRHGVKDLDLVYFDDTDLAEDTEAGHAARIGALFAGLGVHVDVKNEARVHLWYARNFGFEIPPYTSSYHAISTFPATTTAIGVQPSPDGMRIAAPFGVSDLFALIVRPNKVQITRAVYEAKVARWRPLWPALKIVDWEDAPARHARNEMDKGGKPMPAPYTGGCQCGTVHYTLTEEPLRLVACHCKECQRQSGSAFGMSMLVKQASLTVTGPTKRFTRIADSGNPNTGVFCPECGVRIYHIPGYANDLFVLKPGTLDDTTWLRPEYFVWLKSAQGWVPVPDGVKPRQEQP